MARNWIDWHQAYAHPGSSLTARLAIVTATLVDAFDRAPAGEIRCLSLCSGDARDLVGALAGHVRAGDVRGTVVELDETLADTASASLADVAPGMDVRVADAGDPTSFVDAAPFDVLLLVGIFGNISDIDIRRTIAAVPALARPGATVIWSRHRREPDATPMIRAAFEREGCRHERFESPGTGAFAIGVERVDRERRIATLPERLFRFRDDLW